MYDRPTLEELLAAVHFYVQERVQPAVAGDARLAEETRIAGEAIALVLRQLRAGVEPLRAEWQRLDYVLGRSVPFPADPTDAEDGLRERERKLCEWINAGLYDLPARRAALFEHLMLNVRAQLEIANPSFLEELAQEDQNRPL
jgi:hypothetical protein